VCTRLTTHNFNIIYSHYHRFSTLALRSTYIDHSSFHRPLYPCCPPIRLKSSINSSDIHILHLDSVTMAPPKLPLEMLLKIASHLTDDDGELCFADFNSFLKVNRVLHSSLNLTLWQGAVASTPTAERVFTQLIRTNDLTLVKFFLESGAEVETPPPEFDSEANNYYIRRDDVKNLKPTPVKVAAALDTVEMARLLLEHGAEVVQYDERKRPSHSAIHTARSADMVQLLLDYQADPEQQTVRGYRPLHYYAMRSNIKTMRTVLTNGANVDPIAGMYTHTPLHVAAQHNPHSVKLLLEHGADVNKTDYCFYTPLHWAASCSCIRTNKIPLFLKISFNRQWAAGKTRKYLACKSFT
jgi:hypothetical protein